MTKERPMIFSSGMVRALLAGRKTQTRRTANPYGVPGDRLWVRESIRRIGPAVGPEEYAASEFIADGAPTKADAWPWKNKALPSIHLPRGLSRLTLEITSVRVERLQEISEEDATAEGCGPAPFCKAGRRAGLEHVEAFESLWESIHGARAWAANPWVWCVAFRRVTP